ncbi:MAG: flagellar basal body-associated FliL family protein [Nitrospirae bacterium]|nr:flagellar basal body-associated FliL family protein [Nitrospirota bacterium]
MAEDDVYNDTGEHVPIKRKLGTKQIIIVAGIVLVLCGIGFLVFTKFLAGGKKAAEAPGAVARQEEAAPKRETKKETDAPPVLIPMDSFLVNLAEPGRFMKLSIQIEIADKKKEEEIKELFPIMRDAVILLLSSKSGDSVTGPDGKLQLKEEMLLRMNQAVGKDIVKNIYFTDFVIQ